MSCAIFYVYHRQEKLENRIDKANNDIKSLHHNILVLTSIIRELNRELIKHDKGLKRQARIEFGKEETRTEKVRQSNCERSRIV